MDEVADEFTGEPVLKCDLGVRWNDKDEFSTCQRLPGLEMVRFLFLMSFLVMLSSTWSFCFGQ